MKLKKLFYILIPVLLLAGLLAGLALAEDGEIFPAQYLQDAGRRDRKSRHLYDGLLRPCPTAMRTYEAQVGIR